MYYCKTCLQLDPEGIEGHYTRCNPGRKVVNKDGVVANRVVLVANKQRTADRHKNKEARLEYARNLMRKRRAGQV